MQIQPPRRQVFPRSGPGGQRPVLAVDLHQLAAGGHPRQLLEQQAPLAPAGKPELAHQLLVAGLASGCACNPRFELAVCHSSRVGYRLTARRLRPAVFIGWQPAEFLHRQGPVPPGAGH